MPSTRRVSALGSTVTKIGTTFALRFQRPCLKHAQARQSLRYIEPAHIGAKGVAEIHDAIAPGEIARSVRTCPSWSVSVNGRQAQRRPAVRAPVLRARSDR